MRASFVILMLCLSVVSARAQSADLVTAYRAYQEAAKAGKIEAAISAAKTTLALGLRDYGPEHKNTVTFQVNLAALYMRAQKYNDAEPLYLEALRVETVLSGSNHVALVDRFLDLGSVHSRLGAFVAAREALGRSLAIAETKLGPNHAKVGTILNNFAETLRSLGKFDDAIPIYRRALAIADRPESKSKPSTVAITRGNYALLLKQHGKYAESEIQYRNALAMMEKAYGRSHPNVAIMLDNIGNLYSKQGRTADAERLYRRALAVFLKTLGPDHLSTATSMNNLGAVRWKVGAYKEAAKYYSGSLATFEKVYGVNHPQTALALDNLAGAYHLLKNYDKALELRKRAHRIFKTAYGDVHPRTSTTLGNLAELYDNMGRTQDAERLYRQAIAVNEKIYGPDHPNVSLAYGNLASLQLSKRNFTDALASGQQAIDALIRHTQRVTNAGGSSVGLLQDRRHVFLDHVKAAYWLRQSGSANDGTLMDQAFIAAQWSAHSSAGKALAQMSTRFGTGNSELARLVREGQDLAEQRDKIDKTILAVLTSGGSSNDLKLAENRAARSNVDKRLAEIAATFKTTFPEYSSLANPQPLTMAETQKLIGANEALIYFLHAPDSARKSDSVFIWVLTRDEARWFRAEFNGERLGTRIDALRCGLDASSWHDAGGARCRKLLNVAVTIADIEAGTLPPFSLTRSHDLYASLLKPFEAATTGRELMVVATGPLTKIPFQVLLTERATTEFPAADAWKDAAWLGRSSAISVLPSVNSLKSLRKFAKQSRATKPFAGIGNPLLTGSNGTDRSAWAKQKCPDQRNLRQRVSQRLASLPGIGSFFRELKTNVEELRRQTPLPDTADEICAVAEALGAKAGDVWLGEQANEAQIKQASQGGGLAAYKVLHFATHGLVAGNLKGLAEPALLLTPPARASNENDGLLTASEVAQLKTDADWVVMSACNTAAGDAEGAEALSGLARAFFYSGSRALLVSHWAVYSSAAVELTTGTFRALQSDQKIGRAEAFRRSISSVIGSGASYKAHPSYWAPFVIVGEGAAAQ